MNSEIILLLVSGILLAVGAYLWQKSNHLMRHGRKTIARVFDHKEESDRDSTYYYPIIEFITDDKKHMAQQLSVGYDSPKQKGTEIKIIYDPDDPTVVQIDSQTMLEIIPRVFVVAGLCGLVLVVLDLFEVVEVL